MARLAGKASIVTGGAQGMGHAIVERFVAEGASAVVLDLDGELAMAAARAIDPERVLALPGDVARREDVRAAVELCVERFGGIDVMVAHAGAGDFAPVLEIDDATWQRLLAVNLTGVFHCVQEAGRAMVAGGRGGSIVCTSSTNAFLVEENTAHYSATKGGVRTFVRNAAVDLGRHGIRVNSVAPSIVRTRLTVSLTDDPVLGPRYLERVPLRRFADAVDVANAVLFLASDESSYVTGHDLVVDGGVSVGLTLGIEEERLPGLGKV